MASIRFANGAPQSFELNITKIGEHCRKNITLTSLSIAIRPHQSETDMPTASDGDWASNWPIKTHSYTVAWSVGQIPGHTVL